jgi:hypothetical protein
MAVIPGLKESVFAVSYVVYEPSTNNTMGPWRVWWYVLGYLIDALQVLRILISIRFGWTSDVTVVAWSINVVELSITLV